MIYSTATLKDLKKYYYRKRWLRFIWRGSIRQFARHQVIPTVNTAIRTGNYENLKWICEVADEKNGIIYHLSLAISHNCLLELEFELECWKYTNRKEVIDFIIENCPQVLKEINKKPIMFIPNKTDFKLYTYILNKAEEYNDR